MGIVFVLLELEVESFPPELTLTYKQGPYLELLNRRFGRVLTVKRSTAGLAHLKFPQNARKRMKCIILICGWMEL